MAQRVDFERFGVTKYPTKKLGSTLTFALKLRTDETLFERALATAQKHATYNYFDGRQS